MYEQIKREQHNNSNQTNTGDVRVQMRPQFSNISHTPHQDVRIDNVIPSVGLSETQSVWQENYTGGSTQLNVGLEQSTRMPLGNVQTPVIQRDLFIRKATNITKKKYPEMLALATEAEERKTRIPHHLAEDTGYLEITENMIGLLIMGFKNWAGAMGVNPSDDSLYKDKIVSMINKIVKSADPQYIYAQTLGVTKMPRLKKDEKREVSYYFDSLNDFYEYLNLSIQKKEDPDMEYQPDWLKINTVNTGAGDAIVMTLPRGYLIVDLGTNLNILLNYLGLRKNKRGSSNEETGNSNEETGSSNEEMGSSNERRGIPLIGEETCIVITHNHTDHNGGTKFSNIISGCNEYLQHARGETDSYKRLIEFLTSGGFQIYDFGGIQNAGDNPNRDSLVIGRSNGSEAVILSGDQEPDRLIVAIDGILKLGNNPHLTVQHIMYKVAHHGSSTNNPPKLIEMLNDHAKSVDFIISSGKKYNHPNTKMFLNKNELYSQGSIIKAEGVREQAQNEEDKNTTNRFVYTANLTNGKKNSQGSIGYKNYGTWHTTYSKLYTAIKKKGQLDQDRQQLDLAILESMIRENWNHVSEEAIRSDLVSGNADDITKLRTLNNIYPNTQIEILEKIFGANCSQWEYFFNMDEGRYLVEKPKYFDIMVMTCSGETLCDLFQDAVQNKQLDYCKNITAACVRNGRTTAFVPILAEASLFNGNTENCFNYSLSNFTVIEGENLQPEQMGLNSAMICQILCYPADEDNQPIDKAALLLSLDIQSRVKFFKFWLTCGFLESSDFMTVFDIVVDEKNEIVQKLEPSFYINLMQMYPDCTEEIAEAACCNLSTDDNPTQDPAAEDLLFYYIEILEQYEEYNGISIDEVREILTNYNITFRQFLKKLIPVIFEKDRGNDMVLFNCACHFQELETLFEIAYDTYPPYLNSCLKELAKNPNLLSEIFLQKSLNPSILKEFYALLMKNEEIFEILLVYIQNLPIEILPSNIYFLLTYYLKHKPNNNNRETIWGIFKKFDKEVAEDLLQLYKLQMENE